MPVLCLTPCSSFFWIGDQYFISFTVLCWRRTDYLTLKYAILAWGAEGNGDLVSPGRTLYLALNCLKAFRKGAFASVTIKRDPFQGLRVGSCLTLRNEFSEETHILTQQEALLRRGAWVESNRLREPRRTPLPHGSQSWVLWPIILTQGPSC